MILLFTCLLLVHQPSVKAQSSSNIVNYTLFFHNYSLILSATNGSFCVYNGADGSTNSVNPTQANLISEIPGQQTVDGISVSYWSAVIIWAIKLPMDLHVDGTVNINAYISSNFKISGLFSGSGYGMGLVDIDQNNNEAQQFITQAPYTTGGNTFTSTPTEYSVSTNVDYTFKAGHSIGFAVGIGATTQGFTATVYFDSPTYSSGATLPVEDVAQFQSFTANSQTVAVVSDSAISNCQYKSASNGIQFNAEGINYTTGYCNVSIPKALMQSPFTVTSASQQITSTLTENSTYYQLYFTHIRNNNPIQITGTAATQPTSTSTPTGTASASTPPATGSPTSPSSTATSPGATPSGSTTHPTGAPSTSPNASLTVSEYLSLAILAILVVTATFALLFKKKLLKRGQRLFTRYSNR